jgi:hypothetical protein
MLRRGVVVPSALAIALATFDAYAQEDTPAPAQPAAPVEAPPPAPPPAHVPESPTVAPAIPLEPHQVPPTKQYPAVGGHLGMALPLVTLGNRRDTAIGADFVTVGLTPGITVHLDEKWAIDFEFIAFNELKNTPAPTTFVVDPGIIRKFEGFVLGLRVATQVGAPTNSALVPIVVVPFKIGQRAVYFLEMDVPLFVRDGGNKALFSATALFQTGIGF